LKEHMENHKPAAPFCLHFGIKYSKPDVRWVDTTNKSIRKKQPKWKTNARERRRL